MALDPLAQDKPLWNPAVRVIEDKILHLTCINVCMLERQSPLLWFVAFKCLKKKEEKKERKAPTT